MWELIYHWCGVRYIKCHECETLKLLLEEEKRTNKRLLDELLKEPVKIEEAARPYEPIKPAMNLSRAKQWMEAQDLKRANDAANAIRVQELEKELKLNEA